jgi:hypothetical protein
MKELYWKLRAWLWDMKMRWLIWVHGIEYVAKLNDEAD